MSEPVWIHSPPRYVMVADREGSYVEYAPKPEWLPISRLSEFERDEQEVLIASSAMRPYFVVRGTAYWHSAYRCESTDEVIRADIDAVFLPLPERP